MEKESLGFVGLGLLGSALAERILQSDVPLVIWNRTEGRASALTEMGAKEANSIQELAEKSTIVLSCVTDDNALRDISRAIVSPPSSTTLHVSLSTVSPGTIKEIAKLHEYEKVDLVNCPVMGRPDMVRSGNASILLSGPVAAQGRATTVLECMAHSLISVGTKIETASVFKLCLNYMLALQIAGLSEAFRFVQAANSDEDAFFRVFCNGPTASPVMRNYGEQILAQDFEPALFKLKTGLKDMRLLEKSIGREKHAFLLDPLIEAFHSAAERGYGDCDWTAVGTGVIAQSSNTVAQSEKEKPQLDNTA
ncbi:MAG: NAD(P)-dependent oxidoreductase [Pseudomonadota bacterium]